MVKVKNSKDIKESLRDLLILQLFYSKVPILDIAKAAGISSRDIYRIIPKKSNKTSKSKSSKEKNS